MRCLKLILLAPFVLLAAPAAALDHHGEEPAGPQPNVTAVDLVDEVAIPFDRFTLDNGLRVIVHEDRNAPVVAVSVWYHIGSRHEPEGQTGFAHLFEHLMFNGSENAPGSYFEPLRQIGATDFNGTTWFDRTNYFQTVPTQGLELALYLESDRMGYLLGAVTEEELENQRDVVQNEKRQGDNQPYGLVSYAEQEALFPEGHPYRHSTIGSMADLEAATMEDVRNWFRAHYGPNNAVLVLAGDIDVETARTMVERYFGAIPRGPETEQIDPGVPTLEARQDIRMQDSVAVTRLTRSWVVPGLNDPVTSDLDVAAAVFGGLASSRLDTILVRDEQTAAAVSAGVQQHEYLSIFRVTVYVAPTADADAVSERLDELIADYIATGPTQDEVNRVAMSEVAGRIAGLDRVGGFTGKAGVLATGELYSGDPAYYRTQMRRLGAVTPESAQAAMQQWLSRPVLAIRVDPGERGDYQEAPAAEGSATDGLFSPAYFQQPGTAAEPDTAAEPAPLGTRAEARPDVGEITDLDFPPVQRATLSNGVELLFVQRTGVPRIITRLSFDAGNAADRSDQLGTQQLMLSLMTEGTTSLNSNQIAEAEERLGAVVGGAATIDRTRVSLTALSANYEPALDLLRDVLLNPAFDPDEIERLRATQLTAIAAANRSPASLASLNLWPQLFGADHPYGRPTSGLGTLESVSAITREDLIDFHRAWIRPDKLTIMVVGDIELDPLVAALEQRFGSWTGSGEPGVKALDADIPPANPRIILVDRPNSPQSIIAGGQVMNVRGTDELLPLLVANEALGGSFLSRLNQDLRETRGWSYGVSGAVNRVAGPVSYTISAPVQTNRTGDSIAALLEQVETFLTEDGVRQEEFDRAIAGGIRSLPGRFESSAGVMGGLANNDLYERSVHYYDEIARIYRSMDRDQLDSVARAAIDPEAFTWVVVGDATQVREQLDALGLPVETVPAE